MTRRRRDRRAAERAIRHLFATRPDPGCPKSDEELTIEAFLWDMAGAPRLAALCREARS